MFTIFYKPPRLRTASHLPRRCLYQTVVATSGPFYVSSMRILLDPRDREINNRDEQVAHRIAKLVSSIGQTHQRPSLTTDRSFLRDSNRRLFRPHDISILDALRETSSGRVQLEEGGRKGASRQNFRTACYLVFILHPPCAFRY